MNERLADFFNSSLQIELTGKPIELWLLATAAAITTFVVLRLVVSLARRRLGAVAARTITPVDDAIVNLITKTKWWTLVVVALFAGAQLLKLSDRSHVVMHTLVMIVMLLQLGIWGNAALKFTLEHYRKRRLETDVASVTALNAIGVLASFVLWVAILLLALDNLDFDVTALIAGLGIGGVAVALAVQNILGDLFASLSILIDKPFVVGDFIIVDNYLGSVENVGLKSTRLRSLSGEQLVISNSDLLKSRLRNYGRMYERRVVFTIGVTYQTPRDKLKKIPGILRAAIEAQEHTRFDRSHFAAYGDFSINFETVYYVLSPDYAVYMDTQQAVNLIVHEQFENEAIDFAYPTQTLFVRNEDPVEAGS